MHNAPPCSPGVVQLINEVSLTSAPLPEMCIAPAESTAVQFSNMQRKTFVSLPMILIAPAIFGALQLVKLQSVMFTWLPVMNIAPASVSLSFAPSVVFAYTTPKVNVEFETRV